MAKNINLAKLFGVEGVIVPKTLVTETREDIDRKTANEAGEDIRSLLDQIAMLVAKQDIYGVIDCLDAMQLRLDMMQEVAADIIRRLEP